MKPNIHRIVVLFLLTISLYASGQTLSVNPEKYLKAIPDDANIDWSKDICNIESVSDLISHKKVIFYCKSVLRQEVFNTYLMDTNKRKLLLEGFIPTRIIRSGKKYELVLYSDNEAAYILIEISQTGVFGQSYLIDGEPLSNNIETIQVPVHSILAYPGLLVWFSPQIISNSCLQDVSRLLKNVQFNSGSLYMHTPMQIRVIPLDSNKDIKENIDRTLSELIEKTVNDVLRRDDRDVAFDTQLFVFLAINSPNKATLEFFVNKYKKQINPRIFDAYKASLACK